jgi:hypothetical protein
MSGQIVRREAENARAGWSSLLIDLRMRLAELVTDYERSLGLFNTTIS